MSVTIDEKSAVASGWKTIAALPDDLSSSVISSVDRRRRHGEQPALRRLLDLALAGEDVEQAHQAATPCSWRSSRWSAAIRFSIGGCVEKRLPSALPAPGGKM